jgi:ParB/RepB/Spo0J family partition protein
VTADFADVVRRVIQMLQIDIPVDCLIMEPPDQTKSMAQFCEGLARSIDHDGLLQPPVVRPDPASPGLYRVIAGRKRIYAMAEVLGWPDIPCLVASGLDAEMAESAELAENLFRVEPPKAKRVLAVQRWKQIYERRHPLAAMPAGPAKAAAVAAEVGRRVQAASANGQPRNQEQVKAEVAEESKPYWQVLRDTLGLSDRTAQRLAEIARDLTPNQLRCLARHEASLRVCERLAKLDDEAAVAKAINFIESGMDHLDAVRLAEKAAGKTPEDEPAEQDLSPSKEPDLTDDEWLDTNCKQMLHLLRKKGPFRKDAILYRRIFKCLVSFRGNTKKALAEAKGRAEGNGPFYYTILRAVRASHPGQWHLCAACDGTGQVSKAKDGKTVKEQCPTCFGAAYRLRIED